MNIVKKQKIKQFLIKVYYISLKKKKKYIYIYIYIHIYIHIYINFKDL